MLSLVPLADLTGLTSSSMRSGKCMLMELLGVVDRCGRSNEHDL